MISSDVALLIVWAVGTAYHAPRILKRWSLITTCDPLELCDACRGERRRVMHEADEWEPVGRFGGPLMVLVEAAIWYLKPLDPAIRKAVGKELLPTCSKGSCLAYTGGKAAA